MQRDRAQYSYGRPWDKGRVLRYNGAIRKGTL